jgi:sialic acid synthase SpsE
MRKKKLMINLKKNKIIKIAEIGLNHLGSEKIADEYLNNLLNTNIDGITFQIKREEFYKKFKLAKKNKTKSFANSFRNKKFLSNAINNNKLNKLTLSNNFYKHAIKKCKDNKKLIGFAVQDLKKIDFLNSQKIDFYKILNEDIDNEKLIKKISKNKTALKIISTSDNSISQINKTIKMINKNSNTLISITNFENKLSLKYLNKIKKYKKIFNLKIGYGNHSEINSLYKIFKYEPNFLLVYVKLDDKKIYPDNSHAINLKYLKKYLKI